LHRQEYGLFKDTVPTVKGVMSAKSKRDQMLVEKVNKIVGGRKKKGAAGTAEEKTLIDSWKHLYGKGGLISLVKMIDPERNTKGLDKNQLAGILTQKRVPAPLGPDPEGCNDGAWLYIEQEIKSDEGLGDKGEERDDDDSDDAEQARIEELKAALKLKKKRKKQPDKTKPEKRKYKRSIQLDPKQSRKAEETEMYAL
jgi:hypothetical protein